MALIFCLMYPYTQTRCSQRYSYGDFPRECLILLHSSWFSCCKISITACVRKAKYQGVAEKTFLSPDHSHVSYSFCKCFSCLFRLYWWTQLIHKLDRNKSGKWWGFYIPLPSQHDVQERCLKFALVPLILSLTVKGVWFFINSFLLD